MDQPALFDAVSVFDLAKLLSPMANYAIADRLHSVMSQARQNEISWIMRRDVKIDPLEISEIERRFIDLVRSIKPLPPNTTAPSPRAIRALPIADHSLFAPAE